MSSGQQKYFDKEALEQLQLRELKLYNLAEMIKNIDPDSDDYNNIMFLFDNKDKILSIKRIIKLID